MKNVFLFIAVFFAVNSVWAQWEPAVRLTDDPGSSMTSGFTSSHTIAASGDSIHIVWYDDRSGENEIYYKRSTDGGLTWGEDVRLTSRDSVSVNPSIAVSGSVVHVAWTDYLGSSVTGEIYYKRSTDGGNTWSEDTQLSDNPGYYTWAPCMAVSGSTIHLVYYTFLSGSGEIFYLRSPDSGLTWEPVNQLTNDQSISAWPSISAIGPVLHVAWYDRRDGNDEIYYKRSTDAGITWGPDIRLTNYPLSSAFPCIGASESDVHIVWEESRDGNSQIYYKRSTDGGISWGEDTRLTNTSGASYYNNIAVSGLGLFVVWADERDGNWEIYYKCSLDGGNSWEQDVRLTNDQSESNIPYIATSDPQVHVIWYDNREINFEIFYKRDPTGVIQVGFDDDLASNSDLLFRVYPNPASSIIYVQIDEPLTGQSFLTIRDILGETVLQEQIQSQESIVYVSNMENGIYLVEVITNEGKVYSRKLIIQK